MKSVNKKRLLSITALVIIPAFVITGCSTQDQPPEIPPESTLVMDFSDFDNSKSNTAASEEGSQDDVHALNVNWGWAAFNAAFWNVVLTVNLVIPVVAFHESFNHVPVQQPDGTWVWSYNFTVGVFVYTAALHAGTDEEGQHAWLLAPGGRFGKSWTAGPPGRRIRVLPPPRRSRLPVP